MNFLPSQDMIMALAWTIIHSLWQFSIIGLILFFVLRNIDDKKPNLRYGLSLFSLTLAILSSLITFSIYAVNNGAHDVLSQVITLNGTVQTTGNLSIQSHMTNFMDDHFALIVSLWFLGMLLFIVKSIGGFIYLNNLKKSAVSADSKIINVYRSLKIKFDIIRNVKVAESGLISSPMVIGYVKPIILFPIGMVNNLSTEEVGCILAHELAHIKRHDYIINVCQIFIENIFYYHPAIWYISKAIRSEREKCCDDMAIKHTSSQLNYAKTLVKVQEIKISNQTLALAFNGSKKTFKNRIMRLIQHNSYTLNYKKKFITLFLLLGCVFLTAAKIVDNNQETELSAPELYVIDACLQDPLDIKTFLDTIPEKNTFHITKKTNEKELELKMENGEITKLKVDGKEIPKEEYDSYDDVIVELSPNEDKDIITLFPKCDSTMGRIFYIDKNKHFPIRLDSLIGNVEKRVDKVYEWGNDEIIFDFGDLSTVWIDSLTEELSELKLEEYIVEKEFKNLDSILNNQYTNPFKHREFKWKGHFDDQEDIVIELENIFEKSPEHRFGTRETIEELLEEIEIELEDIDSDQDIIIKRFKNAPGNNNRPRLPEIYRKFDIEIDDKKFEDFDVFKDLDIRIKRFDNDNIFELEREYTRKENRISDIILEELNEDELLIPNEKNKVELSGKHLKINGDKQPKNIWDKYKRLYERNTGLELHKKNKIEIEVDADSSKEDIERRLFIRRGI